MSHFRSRFHHAGYVVRSIQDSASEYQRALFLSWDGLIVHDPLQMVRVTFLPALVPGEATVELVEPAGPRSPVRHFLENHGEGIHHVCYEVEDLTGRIAESVEAGNTLVRIPMRAAAFDQRKIAWVRTPSGVLVEYLEAAG